jgi:hypothetical protein
MFSTSRANRIVDCANALTRNESCAIDGEITVGICHVSPKPATNSRRELSNQQSVVDDIGRIRRMQQLASGLAA